LYKIKDLIDGEKFFVAYGDDLSNVNINNLLEFHNNTNTLATLTTIQPNSQFGVLDLDDKGIILRFKEKDKLDTWINAGFFVFDKKIFDYYSPGYELEKEVFEKLAADKKISAFRHEGFWKCMNTLKDLREFRSLWNNNKAYWKF